VRRAPLAERAIVGTEGRDEGRMTSTPQYTGSGAYCYANSLHMCLQAAGADDALLDPGFLECLTTMPFGTGYLRVEDGAFALPSPMTVDPDRGLTRALDALGWACNEWSGDDADEALGRLHAGLAHGPVLLGPLDMGYLSYRPDCARAPAGDHHIVALGLGDDQALVHDPDGYPCAVLPLDDFLAAWRAESIDWKTGAHRLRAAFRPERPQSRREAITRTLPLIREALTADPDGPIAYGGAQALALLAADLRGDVAARRRGGLVSFFFPLAIRRRLDGARFFREAGLPEEAAILDGQALVWGQAQTCALQGRYGDVAACVDEVAAGDNTLARLLAARAV